MKEVTRIKNATQRTSASVTVRSLSLAVYSRLHASLLNYSSRTSLHRHRPLPPRYSRPLTIRPSPLLSSCALSLRESAVAALLQPIRLVVASYTNPLPFPLLGGRHHWRTLPLARVSAAFDVHSLSGSPPPHHPPNPSLASALLSLRACASALRRRTRCDDFCAFFLGDITHWSQTPFPQKEAGKQLRCERSEHISRVPCCPLPVAFRRWLVSACGRPLTAHLTSLHGICLDSRRRQPRSRFALVPRWMNARA